MSKNKLTSQRMMEALQALDRALDRPVILTMGGGGAMILAHSYPLATTDIDAIPKGIEIHELSPLVEKVAISLNLPGDWLNPYFSAFTFVLPPSYKDRLQKVFHGENLQALALGKEDMLIMKCFAHRQKDIGHGRALIKGGADVEWVESYLAELLDQGVRGADDALEFLDDLLEASR